MPCLTLLDLLNYTHVTQMKLYILDGWLTSIIMFKSRRSRGSTIACAWNVFYLFIFVWGVSAFDFQNLGFHDCFDFKVSKHIWGYLFIYWGGNLQQNMLCCRLDSRNYISNDEYKNRITHPQSVLLETIYIYDLIVTCRIIWTIKTQILIRIHTKCGDDKRRINGTNPFVQPFPQLQRYPSRKEQQRSPSTWNCDQS